MRQGLAGHAARIVSESTRELIDRLGGLLPGLAAVILVLLVSWGLATIARRIAGFAARYVDNPTRRNLMRQVSYYVIWAIGVVVALDVVGVDVQSVVTGLGLGSVALGFALKDILSNLVSGLMILLSGAFEVGDQIVVGETEGTVERIEVRVTHIRTYDGRLVLVPNGDVFMSRVVNNTASPLRRASVFVYLDYSQDLEQAMSVILQTASHVPGVASSPAPSMRLHDLTPQHLLIEARVWADSKRADFMNTASAVRVAIVSALVEAGIALPNPDQRTVRIVESVPLRDLRAAGPR